MHHKIRLLKSFSQFRSVRIHMVDKWEMLNNMLLIKMKKAVIQIKATTHSDSLYKIMKEVWALKPFHPCSPSLLWDFQSITQQCYCPDCKWLERTRVSLGQQVKTLSFISSG